jgi:hypothetical protein
MRDLEPVPETDNSKFKLWGQQVFTGLKYAAKSKVKSNEEVLGNYSDEFNHKRHRRMKVPSEVVKPKKLKGRRKAKRSALRSASKPQPRRYFTNAEE